MTLPPRWRKVFSDLASHKSRTALVVLSISVGVFAIAVVMGGRGVLLREFDEDYAASRPPHAEFATSDFSQGQLRQVERQRDVAYAEARRRVSLRFTRSATPAETTAGWSTVTSVSAIAIQIAKTPQTTPEKSTPWGTTAISRFQPQTALYLPGEETYPVDLEAFLRQQAGPQGEVVVRLGRLARLPVRLIFQRLPDAVVAERRRKAKRQAQKEGRSWSSQ